MAVLHGPRTQGQTPTLTRAEVRGKFFFIGDKKLYIRGVTYGTFRPGSDGSPFPPPEVVEKDFASMAESGINSVRTYTPPPRWLLDLALSNGLRVMVGLPWEQHVAFLHDGAVMRSIEQRVRAAVRSCSRHPAILCYAVGNEIPASIVRWHGPRPVERFLKRLYLAVKEEDPDGLVTYVNYPSTEYLDLPFLDLLCFNVYLESQDRLEAYLARLQNLAGERPLVMGEIGLDSRRNGEQLQARALDWQIRTAFLGGCAGTFVFSWTDEWFRGGYDIGDWDFGLVRRDRSPKPALSAVGESYSETPFPPGIRWPRISVVICTYNGSRTIRDCLEGLAELDYPDFEVIVVNDGSTDSTSSVLSEFPFRVIHTPNGGLSRARNVGLQAATGEIVAYTDDDARPDPDWLRHLALVFIRSDHAGVGGPNIAPDGDGPIAACVANAPGGPVHVLLSDTQAEHIPGCNMAFRTEALRSIGGFDPIYRAAGDDVDVCWRLQQRGMTLGFSPAAVVWHHRRNSVRAYWRQQKGYGKAEALLERKWPEKYNAGGHLTWPGRLYGRGLTQTLKTGRGRVFHGLWGLAPFQSVYEPAPDGLASLVLMPEWWLIISFLVPLAGLGLQWEPLQFAQTLLALALTLLIGQSVFSARRATFPGIRASRWEATGLYALTALLHLIQPLARLWGRLRHGLTPWRSRGVSRPAFPRQVVRTTWSQRWRSPAERLQQLEAGLHARKAVCFRGGAFDRWDLHARGGLFGGARLLMGIEEHGAGNQLLRFRIWPHWPGPARAAVLIVAAVAVWALADQAWGPAAVLGGLALALIVRSVYDCGLASAALLAALPASGKEDSLQVPVEPAA